MPRTKKPQGRPAKLPPRIDATPEQLAQAMLKAPPKPFRAKPQRTEYRCAGCQREVYYPEVLYLDGLCAQCHKAR